MKTDIVRWAELSNSKESPSWKNRNFVVGSFIPEGVSVLDIGAGNQHIRNHIPESCTYQPVDCIAAENVIVVDFNNTKASTITLPQKYDIAICSGVLEYITDGEEFLKFVVNNSSSFILTYVFADNRRIGDDGINGWCSGLTRNQMLALFNKLGIKLIHETAYKKHSIMLLTPSDKQTHQFLL